MSRSSSKTRRAARAAGVTARSAQSSGIVKCYVERFENAVGAPDLRLREKSTKRLVRVLTDNQMFRSFAPLSNLLQDCYAHGGGLVEPRSRAEYVAISAPIVKQGAHEIAVAFEGFSVKVHIVTADVASPPTSVWAYIEEYPVDGGGLGLRLRQKVTGRKVEMYGRDQDHLLTFLGSPQFTGADSHMPNVYQKDGFDDYVLVSGGAATDSYDVLLFNDGAELTYLLACRSHSIKRSSRTCTRKRSPMPETVEDIEAAIEEATTPGFREQLASWAIILALIILSAATILFIQAIA